MANSQISVILFNCLFQNILPLTILRVKSKSLWFVIINLTVFFTIVLWYITGYLVVLLIASIRNGSGKTLLLKPICGLINATEGYVEVFNKKIGVDTDFPEEFIRNETKTRNSSINNGIS